MKRLASLFLAALLAAAPVAQADLRASSGAFGPIAATSGTISTGVTGVATLLQQSGVALTVPADATEDTLVTITVPANTIGANGALRITTIWSWTNSANTKTPRIRYSGAAGTQFLNAGFTTTAGFSQTLTIWNRGATNSQVSFPNNTTAFGASTNAPTTSAVDTTASSTIVITGQKGLAGESLVLEAYTVEVIH